MIEKIIIEASERFKKIKNDVDYDISEENWEYVKGLLRKYNPIKPIYPRVNFIDECIELEWKEKGDKIVLSFSSYFDDVVFFVRMNEFIKNGCISRKLVEEIFFDDEVPELR